MPGVSAERGFRLEFCIEQVDAVDLDIEIRCGPEGRLLEISVFDHLGIRRIVGIGIHIGLVA